MPFIFFSKKCLFSFDSFHIRKLSYTKEVIDQLFQMHKWSLGVKTVQAIQWFQNKDKNLKEHDEGVGDGKTDAEDEYEEVDNEHLGLHAITKYKNAVVL